MCPFSCLVYISVPPLLTLHCYIHHLHFSSVQSLLLMHSPVVSGDSSFLPTLHLLCIFVIPTCLLVSMSWCVRHCVSVYCRNLVFCLLVIFAFTSPPNIFTSHLAHSKRFVVMYFKTNQQHICCSISLISIVRQFRYVYTVKHVILIGIDAFLQCRYNFGWDYTTIISKCNFFELLLITSTKALCQRIIWEMPFHHCS